VGGVDLLNPVSVAGRGMEPHMKTETTHTPTPWTIDCYDKDDYIFGSNGRFVVRLIDSPSEEEKAANAAFIIRAVNNFQLAIRYLAIEHRKEKSQSFHTDDCDLCDFIAKGEGN